MTNVENGLTRFLLRCEWHLLIFKFKFNFKMFYYIISDFLIPAKQLIDRK